MTGIIERLLRESRTGFIAGDDGQDYLFYESALRDVPFGELRERDTVTFDVARGPTQSRAEVVRLVRHK